MLNLRVKTLNDTIKEKDNEISFLKFKIYDLKNTLGYWKDKFLKVISLIKNKLLGKEKEEVEILILMLLI